MKVKFMPNVYAILGESNTRKSSTVRALTGAGQLQEAWRVAMTLPPSNIEVYVQIRSLQEGNGITPMAFTDRITELNKWRAAHPLKFAPVTNILIPLRISAFNNCPDGTDYLNHFASVGWNIIRPIVVLGAAALPTAFPAHHPVPGSATMPANGIASQIRPLWNWL
jgi:hypothetical protein